jgi:hypothetical protein|tara:strand:+ start:6574 stop:7419 length:846 start_codon:yes stop_codon:yes gene_type:complete
MTNTLENLVDDIYDIIDKGFYPGNGSGNLEKLGEDVKRAVIKQLHPDLRQRNDKLRMSNLGKKDRQLWYEINSENREELQPQVRLKFLFGDIIEALLIYLTKEANYEVTHEQAEVEIDDVVGHMDCKVNGVMVDVKSASSFSFKKFQDGTLTDNDPFGYIGQVSAYAYAEKCKEAGFLVMDKQLGKITYMPVKNMINVPERIKKIKQVIAKEAPPPEKCYEPVADGKSGNYKLDFGCSYCSFKHECWSDANDGKGLRTFLYSTGPRFLTSVEKEPNVHEIS